MPSVITMALTPAELDLLAGFARAAGCSSRSDALRAALLRAAERYAQLDPLVRDALASRHMHKPRRSRRCIVIRDGAMVPQSRP